jgi:hypothetical protein
MGVTKSLPALQKTRTQTLAELTDEQRESSKGCLNRRHIGGGKKSGSSLVYTVLV